VNSLSRIPQSLAELPLDGNPLSYWVSTNSCSEPKNQNDRANQVANDAETEEPLVSGDVVDRRGHVPSNEQFAGNVDCASAASPPCR
jgi:hypothetical protein